MARPTYEELILGSLNPPQREAVERIDGPLLVLAGAGTGKTRVITHRIAWMIHRGVPPAAILGVTFTNKAAREMRERVRHLTGRWEVRLATFHSFCAAFLREEMPVIGRAPTFTIYDESDALAVVRHAVDELELSADHHKPSALRERISAWKNAFCLPEQAIEEARGSADQDAAWVYEAYDRRLREANACDFDDLLVQTLLLLRGHEDVLARWRGRITHLLVDEFQDTNRIQYEMVKLLGEDEGNLCVTGDQDQSIYSWRGAEVANFDRFLEDFPEAGIVKLEQNYRSTGNILGAASRVIARNRHRIPKKLWTEAEAGDPVRVTGFPDDYEEALAIADRIRDWIAAGTPPRSIAILLRTNSLSLPIERVLLQSGIAYEVIGGLEFFARTEVKDLLAWLRFLVNPSDTVSLARLLDAPPRGIGDSTRAKIEELARAASRPVGDLLRDRTAFAAFPAQRRKAVEAFASVLDRLEDDVHGDVEGTIMRVLETSGFAGHWREKASKNGALDPYQNLGQVVNLAREFDRIRTGSLGDFLAEVSLLTDLDRDRSGDGEEPVAIMTLHSAKGLEFDGVFLAGVDRGILPHTISERAPEGREEERRLLHVGMTRARKRLVITFAALRNRFGKAAPTGPSPFLDELGDDGVKWIGTGIAAPPARWIAGEGRRGDDPEGADAGPGGDAGDEGDPLLDIRPGTRVRHPDWGNGRVAAIRGRARGLDSKLVVDFEGNVRTFILRFSGLEIVDDGDDGGDASWDA